MSGVTIRQAVLADLDALAGLFDAYRRFYGCESDIAAAREFLLARFNHGESVLFLAHENDVLIGFTQLYPSFSSISLARVLILNDLFVVPSARKKGVGRDLLAAATGFAKTIGAVRLSLSTAKINKAAQSLYETCGWKQEDEFLSYNFTVSAG